MSRLPTTKTDSIGFGINNKGMDDLAVSDEIKNCSSSDLIDYIGMKKDFPDEAKAAFEEFCMRFQEHVVKVAEIVCDKWNYNEVVALDIANCTFERVWKYHSFSRKSAKSSDENKAIKFWLYKIIMSQLANHYNNGTCHQLTEDEDLSIITNVEELIDYTCSGDVEKKKELRQMLEILERGMSLLKEKHRIIFLTYKAYERPNQKPKKRVPRSVLEKLRVTLNLTQTSVQLYKNESFAIIEKYIKGHGKN